MFTLCRFRTTDWANIVQYYTYCSWQDLNLNWFEWNSWIGCNTSMHFGFSGEFKCSITLKLFGSSDKTKKWLMVHSSCFSGICRFCLVSHCWFWFAAVVPWLMALISLMFHWQIPLSTSTYWFLLTYCMPLVIIMCHPCISVIQGFQVVSMSVVSCCHSNGTYHTHCPGCNNGALAK